MAAITLKGAGGGGDLAILADDSHGCCVIDDALQGVMCHRKGMFDA